MVESNEKLVIFSPLDVRSSSVTTPKHLSLDEKNIHKNTNKIKVKRVMKPYD